MSTRKKEKKWWTKRKVSTFLLGLFIFWFLLVLFLPLNYFLIGVPEISWTTAGTMEGLTIETSIGNLPPVNYTFIITFTALGSYSVNNPIKTTVTLRNVSLPNFLDIYQLVTFSNAYDSPFKYTEAGYVNTARIFLTSMGDNTYKGAGTIVWMLEGDAYGPIALPNAGGTLPMESMKQSAPRVLTISGVSDTLTQVYAESTLKIGLLLSSFSPLILQPVIEAIVLKSDDKE